MKVCTDCKKEYSDELEKCPECNVSERSNTTQKEEEWLILTTVSNDIEFQMIIGLLQMANIPAVRKVKGVDGFVEIILGMPIAGIDILVPSDKYEEATQLLNAEIDEEELNNA